MGDGLWHVKQKSCLKDVEEMVGMSAHHAFIR
jgi:hypothetical protein